MIFETQRLYIRELTSTDFSAFHEMQVNPNVLKYIGGRGYDEVENRKQLNGLLERYKDPHNDFWVWAVVRKEDEVFLGTVAIIVNDKQENEIGYRFSEKHWGKGYGWEATEALIEYCLQKMKLTSLVSYVDPRNDGSNRIMEKSKFEFIGKIPNEEGFLDNFYKLEL